MKRAAKVMVFLPANVKCTFVGQPSILEIALENHVELNHSCGGMGSCTTCRVVVNRGLERLAPRNEIENEHAQMRGFAKSERLACQTTAVDELVVAVPESFAADGGDDVEKS